MFASVALRTCRVTMLIHPTAAFFFVCWNWDIGWSGAWWEWCRCLARSQSAREREKGRKKKNEQENDWPLCNQGYRTVFVAVFAALICRRAPGVKTIRRRFSCMRVGAVLNEKVNNTHMPACRLQSNLHPQYDWHKQDHHTAEKSHIMLHIIRFFV